MTKMFRSTSKAYLLRYTILTLSTILLSACLPEPPISWPRATTQEVDLTKTIITRIEAEFPRINMEVSEILSRYRDHPVAILMPEIQNLADGVIPNIFTLEDTQSLFGTYIETNTGSFNFTPGLNSVSIQYLNGVDIVIDRFQFNSGKNILAGDDITVDYVVVISPNNRAITTPDSDQVTITISIRRTSSITFLFSINQNNIEELLALLRIEYVGTGGTTVNYSYSFRHSEIITKFIPNSTVAGKTKRLQRHYEQYDPISGTTPSWLLEESVNYTPSSKAGLWVASSMSNRLIRSEKPSNNHFIVKQSTIHLQNSLNQQDMISYSPDTYFSYVGYEDKTPLMSFGYEKYKLVAQVSGGPYQCSLQQPPSNASGTPIAFEWRDSSTEQLMPSQNFSCSTAVLNI